MDITYKVDYFDSFKMVNRYNEPCEIIEMGNTQACVEVYYPVKKRITVPLDCITEYTN